jgi:hypothetical protein
MLLTLQGNLRAGSADGVSTGFQTMVITDQIGFPEPGLSFQVSTGVQSANVSSPSAFTTLQGLGPTGAPVKKGIFLYVKVNSSMLLQLTFDDGAGGDIVSIVPLAANNPPLILPIDTTKFLKLLEAKGSGQIVYFVCGNE